MKPPGTVFTKSLHVYVKYMKLNHKKRNWNEFGQFEQRSFFCYATAWEIKKKNDKNLNWNSSEWAGGVCMHPQAYFFFSGFELLRYISPRI